MEVNTQKLKSLLLRTKLIDAEELARVGKVAEESGSSLLDYLYEHATVPEVTLGQVVASLLNVPFINLKEVTIPPEVINLIPEEIAREMSCIVFDSTSKGIKVALRDPFNQKTLQYLHSHFSQPSEVYYTTPAGMNDAYRLYKRQIIDSLNAIIQENLEKEAGGKLHRLPIVKIVDTVLEYAYKNRVSDIHLQPYEENLLIRFRIDGMLHDIILLPQLLLQKIINRIKILAQIRTYEVGKFQDGRFSFLVDGIPTDVRVSIVPALGGEKAVLRYLSRKNREIPLEEIGFLKNDIQLIKKSFQKPYGMILATGPTGCGKTTTLYGILKKINRREINISTIEDPVEYQIPEITQIQVDPVKEITFANGLRSLLRQDPNVIMVGEIRDHDTASIAVNAALTGHLLLSTLHTNDAATVIPRLLEMGVEPFLIVSTVNVIIAQRLVRKTCKHCQHSYEVPASVLSAQLPGEIIRKLLGKKTSMTFYQGTGCSTCQGTGYMGRTVISEVLEVTREIQAAVVNKATADQIKTLATKQGMKSMLEDGLEKAQRGLTTIEEVLRVAKE